jgi:glycosyltransferase involved in cell wall biosynthesis
MRGIVHLQLLEIARQLMEIGWQQVCIYNNQPPDWLAEWSETTGGSIMGVPDPGASGAGKVLHIAKDVRPDLVHAHYVALQAPLFRMLRQADFGLIIKTEHTFRFRQKYEFIRRLYRRMYASQFRLFIAVSKYMKLQTQQNYMVSPKRVRLVLNGVNLDYFKPCEDKIELRHTLFGLGPDVLIIAACAHLHPGKRLDMLVRAMPMISAKVPNTHLVIAGGGQEREKLLGMIDDLSLANFARVLSGDNRVEQIYGASDIGVLPSAGEGMPGGALEAMACGLPLVATPCGGLAEVPEEGVSGVLVHNQTPEGLADSIIPLLLDRERRKEMGRAARKRVEDFFDVRRAARETIGIYKELLGE